MTMSLQHSDHGYRTGEAGSLLGRLFRGIRQTWQRRDWAGFAGNDWADTIMAAGLTDEYHAKQGRSTARWVIEKEGRRLGVYVKRHYRVSWWSGFLAWLWPWGNWSPAAHELRNLEWARAHGLPVPSPVAAGEYIGPWGKLQSILAVEELTGMIPLHQAIPLAKKRLDDATFCRWKQGLTRELARLARKLHATSFFHKDLYLCHFFIAREDTGKLIHWPGRVFLIDFHRLARHWLTWPVWLVKDLGQLLYSSNIDGVDARDRLRFWRNYAGRPHSRKSLLARAICFKKGVYLRHNARSKPRPHPATSEVGHA
jgi:hypothetical protein